MDVISLADNKRKPPAPREAPSKETRFSSPAATRMSVTAVAKSANIQQGVQHLGIALLRGAGA